MITSRTGAIVATETTPYAWPAFAGHQVPKLVYLDLLHWIGLAQAAVGHRSGLAHVPILEACRAARAAGTVLFPLSATHYMEMSRIQDPRQRRHLARVMEELSGFTTLAGRPMLMRWEIEAALNAMGYPPRSTSPSGTSESRLLGFGVGWAFGHQIVPRMVRPDGTDATDVARLAYRRGPEAFDRFWSKIPSYVERSLLRGPKDEELPSLRAHGYRPENVDEVADQRAQRERDLLVQLDQEPRWRRGRLRDVVAARELYHELIDALTEELLARGTSLGELDWGLEEGRRFIDLMPGTDVAVTLKTSAHRNRDKSWETNDIHDIDALSVAVPYCDAVVTEKHAHHVLTTTNLEARTGTTILRRLADLHEWLQLTNVDPPVA